jgi:hypothetical protein
MHNVIYQQTEQGQKTRSRLLEHIAVDEELTRGDLCRRSGLTYDQVRRQTKNLCIEGVLKSRLAGGQRYYSLCQNFKVLIGISLIVLSFSWSVPMISLSFGTSDDTHCKTAAINL